MIIRFVPLAFVLLSACNAATPTPEYLASCFGGSSYRIDDLTDMLGEQPNANLAWEDGTKGKILRASWMEEVSQTEHSVDIEFLDIAASPSVEAGDRCGPAVVEVTKLSADGQHYDGVYAWAALTDFLKKTPWAAEAFEYSRANREQYEGSQDPEPTADE